MSFGKYQYQHRFYKQQPHKKMVNAYTTDNAVLPLSNYVYPAPYYTPQISKPLAYHNPLNLRVRAGEIGYNQPGWEGYRLKSYVTEKYAQNYHSYQNDREIIQKFKREAEEQKRRKRFESQFTRNPYRSIQKQPQMRRRTEEEDRDRGEFLPSINPEREQYTQRYDVGVMARVRTESNNSRELRGRQEKESEANREEDQYRERERQRRACEEERQERREKQQRKREEAKLREYRKKYKKMKNKLKEQLALQKKTQEQSTYNKVQGNALDKIEHLISDVSSQIVKNSIILNEGLRVQKQMQQIRNNPPLAQQQRQSSEEVTTPKSRISTYQRGQQRQQKVSPKIVYTAKPLSKSYMELQQLRSQMDYINKKMGIKNAK